MKIEMTASPVFRFKLTEQQVKVLMWCSEHHYDAVCRSYSAVGGAVYGWRIYVDWYAERPAVYNDEYLPCQASWSDLDICCKILEGTLGLPSKDVQIARTLQLRFIDCFKAAKEKIHTIKFDVE